MIGWPITTKHQLKLAILRIGHAHPSHNYTAAEAKKIRKHIIDRAWALHAVDLLPRTWFMDGDIESDPLLDLSWMRAERWKNLGRIARPVAR